MKRPYFYVVAWRPRKSVDELQALVFRSHLVFALSESAAYSKGQKWLEKILPLPGPGNDFVINAEGDDAQVKLVMKARAEG